MQQLAVEGRAVCKEAVRLCLQDAQLVETTARANQEERLRLQSELLAAETAALGSAREDVAALQKQVEELKRQHAEEVQDLQEKIAATQQCNLHITKKLSDCRNELRENAYIINLLTEKLNANGIQFEEVFGKEQQVTEEHSKEYEDVTISEEQSDSESSEESKFELAAPNTRSFNVTCMRENLDTTTSTIFPGSTAVVQSKIHLEPKVVDQDSNILELNDQAGHPNKKSSTIHNIIQTNNINSLNLKCSTEKSIINQAIVNPFTYYMCTTSFYNTFMSKQHVINTHDADDKKMCVENLRKRKHYSRAECLKKYSSKPHLKAYLNTQTTETVQKSLSHPVHSDILPHESHTNEKMYSCSVCSANFLFKSNYNKHMCTHKGEKPFSCSVCSAKFSLNSTLKKHIRTHTSEKPYSCSVCSAKFSQRSYLNGHMRTHTSEKRFPCTVCNAKFSVKSYLKIHMRIHTGEKPFSCSLCTAKFSQSSALNVHMRTHTSEKPFSCSICSAKFSLKSTLTKHIRTHTGEKPYSCSVCSARFSQRSSLNGHMCTHTSEKRFSCTVCSAKFSVKGNLEVHMRLHTGEKPFACSVCSAKFSRKFILNSHMLTHTGEKPFSCSLCSAKFRVKSSLKKHVHKHAREKPFSCSACDAKFFQRSSLNVHVCSDR